MGFLIKIATLITLSSFCFAQHKVPLDKELLVSDDSNLSSVVPTVDIIQRRVVQKNSKFLAQVFASLDFSDAPKSDQALGIAAGYSFSNNLELGLVFLPTHGTQDRSLVATIRKLTLNSGAQADLASPKPKSAYEVHGIWNLAYGKETWGVGTITRSETFVKLGLRQTTYEDGKTGEKNFLLFGKTFLFSPWFNLRFAAGPGASTYYVNGDKMSSLVAVIELGTLFYF